MRLLNRRNMRINLAKRTARKRYLVYTTDDFGKAAVDPTRVFASPQPQNRHFRVPVEKVGLARQTIIMISSASVSTRAKGFPRSLALRWNQIYLKDGVMYVARRKN